MIKESDMIKASDLKVGDRVISKTGIEYKVISNHVGDAIYLFITRDAEDHTSNGLHLFYDDIDYLDYARDILNINLTTT